MDDCREIESRLLSRAFLQKRAVFADVADDLLKVRLPPYRPSSRIIVFYLSHRAASSRPHMLDPNLYPDFMHLQKKKPALSFAGGRARAVRIRFLKGRGP